MIASRPCPICNSQNCDSLCDITLGRIDDELLPSWFQVVHCCDCGFCYDDILAQQADFDKYYINNIKYIQPYTVGSGGKSPTDVKRYDCVISLCNGILKNCLNVLDIGAGKGGLLSHIKTTYNNISLYAVEPSIPDGIISDIRFYSSLDKIRDVKFDMIFCSHVLEHIYDLRDFFNIIKKLSHNNTIIYCEVPNANKYYEGYDAPYYYFDREHINHFTLKSFENLLAQNNFSIMYSDDSNHCIIIGKNASPTINGPILYAEPDNIKDYVNKCRQTERHLYKKKFKEPIVCWGFGAHLRRCFLQDYFPKNIAAIIDRDRSGSGKRFYNIPFVTKDILSDQEFSNATLIITSVLYANQILREIEKIKFSGTVVTEFVMPSASK